MIRTVRLSPILPRTLPDTVLTLNRRAAQRLGVRSLRLNDLALSLVQSAGLELVSPALSHRIMTGVVREVLDVREPGVTAKAVLPAVREFMRSGTPVQGLRGHESLRVAQLAQVTLAYQAALEARGLLDPSEVTRRATALAQPQMLSLSGYPRLLRDEQLFLNAACADGSVLHLPWADHPLFQENLEAAAFFESAGWVVERDGSRPPGVAGAFLGWGGGGSALHVLSSEDEEVRTALGQVKGLLLSGVPATDVALVVPDDERWEGRVRAVADEYGVPVRISTSVTAAETRVGRWVLRALLAVEEDLSLGSVTRLLAHPLDVGLDGEEWRRVREARPATPEQWSDVGWPTGDLQWPGAAKRVEWAAQLTRLMDARGVTDRAAHGLDLVAMNFIRAELAVLSTPETETLTRAQFFEEVRDLLSLVTVPSQLGTTGVELLTPPALIGAEVPHVFFLGMSDGSLPAPLSDDPPLDFLERKRLHASGVAIDTAGTLSRRQAVTFWGALASAGTATFSYARLAPGGSGLPSPYLANLGLREVTAPLFACSPEEARRAALRGDSTYSDAVVPEGRRRHQVEVDRVRERQFSEFDGLGLRPVSRDRVFSASQLGTLGRCAFRWWLEYGLKLTNEEADDSAASLGRLRHGVLERAARRAQAEPDADVREVMLRSLDEDWRDLETELAWPQTPEWERERPEHLDALRRAVRSPDFILPGARPAGAELKFEGEWMGFKVRGTVDRVDELSGKAIVVDYKSGASKPLGVQDRDGKLKVDVQLPIYWQTAMPALFPELKPNLAMYVSLKNGQVLDRLKVNMAEQEALAGRLSRLLREGTFPPRPDVDFKACKYCDWHATCRGGVRLERKEFA